MLTSVPALSPLLSLPRVVSLCPPSRAVSLSTLSCSVSLFSLPRVVSLRSLSRLSPRLPLDLTLLYFLPLPCTLALDDPLSLLLSALPVCPFPVGPSVDPLSLSEPINPVDCVVQEPLCVDIVSVVVGYSVC